MCSGHWLLWTKISSPLSLRVMNPKPLFICKTSPCQMPWWPSILSLRGRSLGRYVFVFPANFLSRGCPASRPHILSQPFDRSLNAAFAMRNV